MDREQLQKEIFEQVRSSLSLSTAFIGVSNKIFELIHDANSISPESLSARSGLDGGYLIRWMEAAYSFGYLNEKEGSFSLTEKGELFLSDSEGSMLGSAVQAVLGSHMAERIASLMKTGERPGEKILLERPAVAPLFGIMLEKGFSSFFEKNILPALTFFNEINSTGGTLLDLGCGNGWYLRKVLDRFLSIRGIGIDGFKAGIDEAEAISVKQNMKDRIQFYEGDLFRYRPDAPVQAVSMNRALHHVWDRKETVFQNIHNFLSPGGYAVIWEPRWPDTIQDLKVPSRQGMAFQNLSEHAQGNFFLTPQMIENEMKNVNMKTEIKLFADGNEAVIIGKKI